jgi:periplasmic mercuric ion binding protein
MKPLILSIISLFFITVVTAQSKQTVKVWGNCGMCKSTIEKAAKNAGAAEVDWNKDTKVLTVGNKSDLKKIEQAIAAAGYDTQNFKAKDEAYFNLPECCQYERKASGNSDTKTADCCKDDKCEKSVKGEKGEKGSRGDKCDKCADCDKCKSTDTKDCCK